MIRPKGSKLFRIVRPDPEKNNFLRACPVAPADGTGVLGAFAVNHVHILS